MKGWFCGFGILGLFMGGAQASADYIFTRFDVPGATTTFASSISDSGDIVGRYNVGSSTLGFLLTSGSYTTLAVPGSNLTSAAGINNAGMIVGGFGAPPTDGFLFSGGNYTRLGVPGFLTAMGINDAVQIVGQYVDGKGSHGFLLSGGNITNVDPNGSIFLRTAAQGINNASQIVGWYFDGKDYRGFTLNGGRYTNIDVPGATNTFVNGINNTGQIVGEYRTGDLVSALHGFVMDGSNVTKFDFPDAIETEPYGINDAGEIVGYYYDRAGHEHSFLATPVGAAVPEPATFLLVSLVALGLIAWRFRCPSGLRS
jgi:hypothetical protein